MRKIQDGCRVVLVCGHDYVGRRYAVSNGSNLNDGMDGMAAGNSAIIGVALGVLAYVSSHIAFASYLNIMYIPGSEELVIFICAFVGALVGFLWYNAYPAQIFMGDTGSLSIGGIIAVTAIIIHKELLIPFDVFRVPDGELERDSASELCEMGEPERTEVKSVQASPDS